MAVPGSEKLGLLPVMAVLDNGADTSSISESIVGQREARLSGVKMLSECKAR